eukprot:scaffold1800_cov387-Prasinococcus_capsulatus_cf.AAC.7
MHRRSAPRAASPSVLCTWRGTPKAPRAEPRTGALRRTPVDWPRRTQPRHRPSTSQSILRLDAWLTGKSLA